MLLPSPTAVGNSRFGRAPASKPTLFLRDLSSGEAKLQLFIFQGLPSPLAVCNSIEKMFGISFGQLMVILGASAVLLGPKDIPIICRAAGKITGRAVGYILIARGQLENVMQQSQVNQVHKELKDAMEALEAIRHQIRDLTTMNHVPYTRILEGMEPPAKNDAVLDGKSDTDRRSVENTAEELGSANANPSRLSNEPLIYGRQVLNSANTNSSRLYNEALTYERLAKAPGMKEILNSGVIPSVLPVSAESAQLLPKIEGEVKGSDIMLEAIIESEVARSAKQFFSLPENQVFKE